MIDVQRLVREAGWSGICTTYKEPDGKADLEPVSEHLIVPMTKEEIERAFALYREAVVQELVAGSGEPIGFWAGNPARDPQPCYTADQLAAAIAAAEKEMK